MNEDRIIAIETSGRQGSVVIGMGDQILAYREFAAHQQHARDLLPMLDALCREQGWRPNELTHCYLSIGPGSFTGLRVAVAFARHLALAAGVKICAVPTMDVMARSALTLPNPPEHVATILDAKRNEVFAALFEHTADGYRRTLEPVMTPLAALLAKAPRPLAVLGEAVEQNRETIQSAGAAAVDSNLWWPRAENVLALGRAMARQHQFTPPRSLVPFYLRRPEAEELWEKRQPKIV
jgi:tRNA threonylcarbamoyladenosine biosynthesis protein TsaB